MGQMSTGHSQSGGKSRLSALPAIAVCVVSLCCAPPAAAQARAPANQEQVRICGAAWAPNNDGSSFERTRTVQALCWGTWLVLGAADAFRVNANPELEATIIELDRAGEHTVLLIRPDAGGRPLIENLGSALAAAAGRTPLGRLDGLALDYGQFAFTGRIGIILDVTPVAGNGESAEGVAASEGDGSQARPTSTIGLEIGDHIARDRARLAATGAQ